VKSFFLSKHVDERDGKNVLNMERAKQLSVKVFVGGQTSGLHTDIEVFFHVLFL
jgi:hypothetical protein